MSDELKLGLMKQPYPNRKDYECAFMALLPPEGVEAEPMAIGLAHTQEQLNVLAAIVHRVNCHGKLVEALNLCGCRLMRWDFANDPEDDRALEAVRAAIELAKGDSHD